LRKSLNLELHDYYSSPNIIREIMRWARRVACRGKERNVYDILVGKPEGKQHLGRLHVDGKIILKFNL
jgi:hypothetical protein